MTIVCGTDFSVHAAEAATVAAALASRLGASLTLIHSIEPGLIAMLEKKLSADVHELFERKLSAEAERLRSTGVQVITELATGAPDVALVEAGKRLNATLIVVSSLGQVAPRQWVVGSVAERTAQSATAPTLVVREYQPLVSWAREKRSLKVLLGYDFSASADAALRWVSQQTAMGGCKLTVACVTWPPVETRRHGMPKEVTGSGDASQQPDVLLRDLGERARSILGRKKARLRVLSGWSNEESQLLELARAEGADLVVVGTNQRRGMDRFWLGSVSRGILNHATMNVACVPLSEQAQEPEIAPAFKRILVPIDFSPLSEKAIHYAFAAAQRGAEVRLLHVIAPEVSLTPDSDDDERRSMRRRKSVSDRLKSLFPPTAPPRGIRSTVEIVEDPTASVGICQAAERFGADLICMGSRGRATLRKKWLGSTLEAVLAGSSRPILVVH